MKTYRDIQGDGGSDVIGQVVALREAIARRLEGIKHILAVGSGKGGVGKSTVTAMLARALQRDGKRTLVLDADVNGPSQARLHGVQGKIPHPGEDGLLLPCSADSIPVLSFGSLYSESQAVEFDSVAHGDSHTWRATREFTALAELLSSVDFGVRDVMIVDLPPGAERTYQFAGFLGPQARMLLVTIPSELSRGVVQRSIEALTRTPNSLLGVVENMSGYYCADCQAVKPLFPSPAAPDTWNTLARIPFDPTLAAACDRGSALPHEYDGPVQHSYTELASKVFELLEGGEQEQ